MAIAWDAASGAQNNYTTALTFSHTIGSGSDRLLFVSFITNNTSDKITGVTYNGTAMTRTMARQAGGNFWMYVYHLVAPDTGTNNVVVSASSGSLIWACSSSYTGVNQTSPIDNTAGLSYTTGTWTGTVETSADNCWLYTQVRAGSPIAASGTTVERRDSGQSACYDSDGAKSPAGTYSNTGTNNSSNTNGNLITVSFAPSGGSEPTATWTPKIIMY